jgi:hypothetical protein
MCRRRFVELETEKQTSLDDELLNLLADQARVSPFNMIAAMGIVSYLIYPHVSDSASSIDDIGC